MWMASWFFSLIIPCLRYLETSYIIFILTPWRGEGIFCVVFHWCLGGLFRTYLDKHWRMNKAWHGLKGWFHSHTRIFIGVIDLWRTLLSSTVMGNSIMFHSWELGEVSPITLLLHYDSLGNAWRNGPYDSLIQGLIFDYEGDIQGYCQRFIRA